MALWIKTLLLPSERFAELDMYYRNDYFPIKIRECLAEWIEETLL
jgi:hypothetical protein